MDKLSGLTKDSLTKGLKGGKDILSKFGKSNPRDSSKFQFDIKLLNVENVPKTDGAIFIAWKRGSKASNNGQTKPVSATGKSVQINHQFTLVTTLQKEKPPKRTYEEKNISISIKEEKGKKSSTLGKTVLNLADFTSSTNGKDQFKMISIKQKKGSALQLTLNVATKELEMDPDEPMTETDMNSNDGSDDEEGEDFENDDLSSNHSADTSSVTSNSSYQSHTTTTQKVVGGGGGTFNRTTTNASGTTTSSHNPPSFQRQNSSRDDESFSSMTNIPSNLDEQHKKELAQLLGTPTKTTPSPTPKSTTPTSTYSSNTNDSSKTDEQHKKDLNSLLSNNTTSNTSKYSAPTTTTTTASTPSSTANEGNLSLNERRLKRENEDQYKKIKDLEKQIGDLQKQKGGSSSGGSGGNVLNSTEYLELKQRFKEVASENVDLEDKIKELEEKLNNTRSGSVSPMGGASGGSNPKDQRQISDLQEQVKQKNKEVQDLNGKVRQLENDLYEQLQQFTLSGSNSSDKDSEIDSLKREVQNLKDQLQQQQQSPSGGGSQAMIGGGSLELKRKIQDLTKEIKDKDDMISKLKSGSSTPSSSVVSPQISGGQVKILETQNTELQKLNQNQKVEIDRLKQELSAAKSSPQPTNNNNRDLQDRIIQLQSENKQLLNELEEVNDKLNESKYNQDRMQQSILDLQDQNEQLQNKMQTSMASASSLSFGAGKASNQSSNQKQDQLKQEKEKLERTLESIQTELQKERDRTKKLQRELDQQNNRVRDLENELASGSSSSSGRQNGNGGSSIAKSDLQEREENRIIEQCIYTQSLTFRDGVGACASSLYSKLSDQNAFSQENSRLFNKVINGLTQSVEKAMYNSQELAYWLSNTSGLIHLIKDGPNNVNDNDRDPLIDGILVNQNQSSPTTTSRRSPSLNFYYQLESLSRECYSLLLHNIYKKLNPKLNNLISSAGVVDKKTNRFSSTMSHTQDIQKLCKVLGKYLNYFKDNFVFDSIVQQFFSQTFHYISYTMLNEIIDNGSQNNMCSPSSGFKIKLSISMIEDWISQLEERDLLLPSKEYLSVITEASNLMVIDKSIFTDSEAILSAFSTLNILQIKKLLEIWKPDQLSPDPIPSSVLSMARGNWNRPTNNLTLQIDPSILIEVSPQLN
ncbi:hypothetical protein DLAC_02020 [Tieghemostelium lacteum]|uniref:Dilute domain-containing protein n=1 Tax=Tieghemostelium lacteum TaxID=361077 RepID=A0A152A4Y5_TIELA|nr:hypothetical protein DLAC_02020 [Tieghemostelium lacteum]|eukprot:KYR01299.1 hypothetical protein DLAC_02020 [Tieghemostelium lacteum]